ncbi:unnamed protein product, partial [Ectocarpus sp. 12 AP-2014]
MVRLLLPIFLLLAALPALAQDQATDQTEKPAAEASEQDLEQEQEQAPDQARPEIENNPIVAQMKAFVGAFDAGDARAIAQIYTDDGALLPPQSDPQVGRTAIAAHYQATFDQGATSLRLQIKELSQLG